jgi:DNA polymerase-3 subunit beta
MSRLGAQELMKALDFVKPGATGNVPLPILNTVLLHADSGTLTLTTTDLEIGFKAKLDYFGEDFQACLPFKALRSIIANGSGEVVFTAKEHHKVTIETGAGDNTLAGIDPLDFPVWQDDRSHGLRSDCETKHFVKACKDVCDKAGDGLRLEVVQFNGNTNLMVATDGHRIGKTAAYWIPSAQTYCVNAKDLKKLSGSLKKVDKLVPEFELKYQEKNLVFVSERFEAIIPMADVTFPDISQVDKVEGHHTEVAKKDLVKAVKLMKALQETKEKSIWLKFEPDSILFMAESINGGAQHRVYCEPNGNAGQVIQINRDYFMKALDACDDDVVFTIDTYNKPILVGDEVLAPQTMEYCPLPFNDTPTVTPACYRVPEKETTRECQPAKPIKNRLQAMLERINKLGFEDKPDCPGNPNDYTWIASHKRTSCKGKGYTVRGHWRRKPHRCKPVAVKHTKCVGAAVAIAA